MTTVSVLVAAFDYQTQLDEYESYKAAAAAAGIDTVAPLPLRPLQLLRPVVEYLEIIGAVIAIALGYLSVARERGNRTLGSAHPARLRRRAHFRSRARGYWR